jgi:hypothetical protein
VYKVRESLNVSKYTMGIGDCTQNNNTNTTAETNEYNECDDPWLQLKLLRRQRSGGT